MPDHSPLFAEIDRHFLAPQALARVALLGRIGRDAGGWFKGELAYVFDRLAKDGALSGWRANVPIVEGRPQRCDFRLVVNGPSIPQGGPSIPQGERVLWLEVKALPGRAGGGGRVDPGFYLQKGGPGDVTEDLVKLMRAPDGDTAVLLFVHPRPDASAWEEIMSAYSRRIAPIAFKEETSLGDYPEALYVCKLRLTGGF
jgi:hypothetical protein